MSAEKATAEGKRWLATARGDLVNADPATHDVVRDLAETAAQLDRFTVPTRYPNGLPDLTPEDAFLESDALRALDLATSIADRVAQATA